MKNLAILLPLFAFLFAACPNASENSLTGSFPEEPEDFVIRLRTDGGMVPLSESVYISQDSAYWKMMRMGNENVLSWKPTEQEFKGLYQVLLDNDFSKIKSDCEGEVFDRGGTSIDIDLEGKDYELNNSGNCFIKDKWSQQYSAINQAIWAHVNQHLEEQMIEVTVTPGDGLLNSGLLFTMNLNDKSVYSQDGPTPIEIKTKAYPGPNDVYMQLFYADSLNNYGSPKTAYFNQEYLDVSKDSTHLMVDFVEDNLVLKLIP